MLVDDDDAIGTLVDDVAVEYLQQRCLEAERLPCRHGGFAAEISGEQPLEINQLGAASARTRADGDREWTPVAHGYRRHERTEGGPHRLLNDALYADPIAKAHLELGGMNIDVDIFGSDLDPEIDRRPVSRVNGGAISRFSGSDQEVGSERSPIHEELGASSGRLCISGALNESIDAKGAGGVLDGDQCACQIAAPYS